MRRATRGWHAAPQQDGELDRCAAARADQAHDDQEDNRATKGDDQAAEIEMY